MLKDKSRRTPRPAQDAHPLLFQDWPQQLPNIVEELSLKRPNDPIWTEHKAKLVERYLYYFVLITRHGIYIDGFSGPQEAGKPDSWAARLVLKSKPMLLTKFFLCERNRASTTLLRKLKKEADRDSEEQNVRREIRILPGDFNCNVDSILVPANIPQSRASFALLDQRTFECHWSTVAKLAAYKSSPATNKIEIFYFLATGWLHRSLSGIRRNTQKVTEWYGSPDWGALKSASRDGVRDLFTERFRHELGYKHVHAWPIYDRQHAGAVMYHMIHATDHDEAPKLMARAYARALKRRERPEQFRLELGLGGSGEHSG